MYLFDAKPCHQARGNHWEKATGSLAEAWAGNDRTDAAKATQELFQTLGSVSPASHDPLFWGELHSVCNVAAPSWQQALEHRAGKKDL